VLTRHQVTLGLCLTGGIPWIKAFLLIPVQLIAGIVASILVSGLFPGALNVQTNLGSGTSVVQGLFIEMMLTAELIFTILMLAVEKHRATFMAPLGIGMAFFLAHIIGK
jgi:aquaporin rerated protein, other eukaryote